MKEAIYLIFLVSVGADTAEHAAHHVAEFKPVTELFRIINFLIVVGVLYFLLSKYIRMFFSSRRDGIAKTISEAEQSKISAEKRLSEWELKTKETQSVILQMIEDAKKEGQFIKDSIIKSANEVSKKMREKAGREIEYETKKARERLREGAMELTLKMAEDILKKRVTKDDHVILVIEYTNKMTNNQITISR
ncbi:MAG: ATP synthase F0 subunit B [Nitrospinae bacterium RIFCSPLOWO2_02_FULL_39_110]|nr:MAG: ATP synthase F0 subunit B [Nitrospinae bacterium RIFCSPHIGHO2_02_39_11]OGV99361.1 MAG: ATP synthase F0 subunit B [Nitrospinae bacterium RIFCSPHIGHO2_12_FULL_39_42]OGW03081.1 MAG: ATP synthase F0 subunit B [Nitrospinae bacterium RIFCSPHIGHO2_02_FULL_39_82]OGW06664.1 MAG: ATP synthase F0 subunit B [Nitrospinae bacterium RIFCSPLOWO2_02_FULL_39_110]OGW06764.1 MAG: ATP synthase F0 subunit B [Nitrospinae bacterium RIFCSPLOWO2_02_39_17]OGW09362.1 MAG: ATP synthase F0 subunit B [Nitrospinae ba